MKKILAERHLMLTLNGDYVGESDEDSSADQDQKEGLQDPRWELLKN